MSDVSGTSTTLEEDPVPPSGDGPQEPIYVAPSDDDDSLGPQEQADDDGDDEASKPLPEVDDLEELEPKLLPVERKLVDRKGRDAVYLQKGLTYFGKIELYGILGRAVQVAMDDDGLGIDSIMDMMNPRKALSDFMSSLPGADESPDAADQPGGIEEAGKMLAAFAKVISRAPVLLKEAYCVILAIPEGSRKWAMDWGLPEIDDEMGTDIMHTFIDQNWGVMEDFFTQELPKVMKRAAAARARHQSAGGRSKR